MPEWPSTAYRLLLLLLLLHQLLLPLLFLLYAWAVVELV
jgi:hypothetical protein